MPVTQAAHKINFGKYPKTKEGPLDQMKEILICVPSFYYKLPSYQGSS